MYTALVIIGPIVIVLVAFVAFVAMQPADFQVSRSATVPGRASEAFAQVNDLHKMNAWSPWLEPDPAAKITYDGPPAGPGASFSWNGNNQIGAGRMTIVETIPNDFIRFKLEFMRPFKSIAEAQFSFRSEGDHTTVTWTMISRKIFMTKLAGLFINMDKMIGGNFEKGLANMKSKLQTDQATQSV